MDSRVRALQRVGRKLGLVRAGEQPALTLETLPYDILVTICEYLAADDGPWPCQDESCNICSSQHKISKERNQRIAGFKSKYVQNGSKREKHLPLDMNYYAAFSLTSKYLREISIPFVFRAMRIAPRTGKMFERLVRDFISMEGKGIFESVRCLSIVFSKDIFLYEIIRQRAAFPMSHRSSVIIDSMGILLRNITTLDILRCKIDVSDENTQLAQPPVNTERRIPVRMLTISHGCGWLIPHLEPRALLIKGSSEV
ncbi:hypothetical protein TWF281_004569 [Arthrobotrys megalospora]